MKLTIAIVSLALLATAATKLPATSSENKQARQLCSHFAGKIVVLEFTKNGNPKGSYIEDAEVKEIGGRMIVEGTALESAGVPDWLVGSRVAVPWETVEAYALITRNAYEKRPR